jgi:hypothetical protein
MSVRVGECDVDDGMVVEPVEATALPVRVTPVRGFHERPPLSPVAEVLHAWRRREYQRAGVEHFRERAGIIARIRRLFRERHVARRTHERVELPVGDRVRSIRRHPR